MTKGNRFPTEAKIFEDRYKILCVECPKCEGFIPNAVLGPMTCPNCKHEFKVIQ